MDARKEPSPISVVLPVVLQHAQQRHATLHQVQECWGQLVGKLLARHTAPVSLRRGRLIVHVDRPGEGFTLNFQRQQLLAQLKVRTGGAVEELVIRVGDLPASTDAARLDQQSHGPRQTKKRRA